MDIRLVTGTYKSIAEFEWLNIPMFAVITGPNGSGKTNLLELIALSLDFKLPKEGMGSNHGAEPEPLKATVEITPPLSNRDIIFLNSRWTINDYSSTLTLINEKAHAVWKGRDQYVKDWKNRKVLSKEFQWNGLWSLMETKLGKNSNDIGKEEFIQALPFNFPLLADGLNVESAIPELFVSYLHSMDILGNKGKAIKEIIAELGTTPWEILNDTLKRLELPYRVIEPTTPEVKRFELPEIRYTLSLENISTQKKVALSHLSAGEKVMFRVALWSLAFYARSENISNVPQRLLLLDEPDAHLHPALTAKFLNVIRSELVEQHGIRVIMTTHSPSTVALTAEANIFVMSPNTPRISQANSKWDALSKLTAGMVTVGTESKCVFVEDKDDRFFYSELQHSLLTPSSAEVALNKAIPLIFIAASDAHAGAGEGKPSGGKNNVEKWVDTIESTQIAGIIDLDKNNTERARLHVLKRYNLESYLLDPLFLYAVLLEQDKASCILDLKLSVHDARKLLSKDPADLQNIIDSMLAFMCGLITDPVDRTNRTKVSYHNGPTVLIEDWFIHISGKVLIEPLKNKFKDLKFDHKSLTAQYRLLEIIPKDLVDMLKSIQST